MSSWFFKKGSENNNVDKSFDPNDDFFFRISLKFIWVLFLGGLITSAYIIVFMPEYIFKGIGLLFTTVWGTIFLSYFRWAVFYYNISYGKSSAFWDQVFKARQKAIDENSTATTDIDVPKYNPYCDQTFGLPPGTVRGMIAFTLLFGALSLLIVSFGEDGNIDRTSFYWDQFEFFKTAFLMMIAFYFGSHSLKYLQKGGNNNLASNAQNNSKQPTRDDDDAGYVEDETKFEVDEEPVNITNVKNMLNNSESDTK